MYNFKTLILSILIMLCSIPAISSTEIPDLNWGISKAQVRNSTDDPFETEFESKATSKLVYSTFKFGLPAAVIYDFENKGLERILIYFDTDYQDCQRCFIDDFETVSEILRETYGKPEDKTVNDDKYGERWLIENTSIIRHIYAETEQLRHFLLFENADDGFL